ncbi:MAG: fibronectin type III domain-containing protein, partial [bacterium]
YDGSSNYSSGINGGARTTRIPVGVTPPSNIAQSKPTNFNVSAGNTLINLTWDNPNNTDFSGVKIVRRTDYSPISPTNGTLVYKGANTSYTNTGLTNGTTYFYTIFAYDKNNNFSHIDSTVKAVATPYEGTPLPNAYEVTPPSTSFTEPNTATQGNIASMNASSSSGQIILTWVNPFNDISWKGTKIIRKTGSYPVSPTDGKIVYNGTNSAYTDTGVSIGTTYYYAAFAYNDWRNYSDGTVSGAKISKTAQ